MLAAAAALGCGAPPPSEPCLGDAPQVITLPFQHFDDVSHEVEGDLELARFTLDRTAVGPITVTVEPARPPYREFNTGEAITVQGHRLWSVRIDGLVGGAATDRLAVDPGGNHLIREIVQVMDPETFRWVVGTAAGACIRLHTGADRDVFVLHVAPDG